MAALTSSDLERILRKDNVTPDDVYETLKNFVVGNTRNQRSGNYVANTLGPIEEEFPQFAAQFAKIREKYSVPRVERKQLADWPPSQPITKSADLTAALSDPRCTEDLARRFINEFARAISQSDSHSRDYIVRKLDEIQQQYPRYRDVIQKARTEHEVARTGAALKAAGNHYVPPARPQTNPEVPPAYGQHQSSQFASPSGPPPGHMQQQWQGGPGQQWQSHPGQQWQTPHGQGQQQQHPGGQQQQWSGQQQQQWGGGQQQQFQSQQQQQQQSHPSQQQSQVFTENGYQSRPAALPGYNAPAQQEDTKGEWKPPNLNRQIFGYVRPRW